MSANNFKFLADQLTQRDTMNEKGCLVADLMQRAWPEGKPPAVNHPDPKVKIREQLIFEMAQCIHALMVAQVRLIEKMEREQPVSSPTGKTGD